MSTSGRQYTDLRDKSGEQRLAPSNIPRRAEYGFLLCYDWTMMTRTPNSRKKCPKHGLLLGGALASLAYAAATNAGDSAIPETEPTIPSATAVSAEATPTHVAALGRLEPQDGIFSVAGPAGRPAVIAELKVDEGDRVEEGAVIAILDDAALKRAELTRAKATRQDAQRDFERAKTLERRGVQSQSAYDKAELSLALAEADVARAAADFQLTEVRAPTAGEVIQVYTRRGERIGPNGIVDLGRTDKMYAVAEVYETDILHVKVGQNARIKSPALSQPLTGTVEQIGRRVGKLDLLSTDPTARTDARVVEVKVRLDDSKAVAGLTNLQVTVEIDR